MREKGFLFMVLRPGSYSIFLGTEMRAITVRFLLATSSSYSPLECAVKYSTHNTILLSCGCLAPARVLTVNLPTFFVFRGGLGYCTFLGLRLFSGFGFLVVASAAALFSGFGSMPVGGSSPASGLTPEQDQKLQAICEAWRVADETKPCVTMADEALEVLRQAGWAEERLLPNETVDASADLPPARFVS